MRDLFGASWGQIPAHRFDAAFGLDVTRLDEVMHSERDSTTYAGEEIWFCRGGGLQSPWRELRAVVARMNLKPGDLVVDLGSGLGRLGLLIGLLYPEVRFQGLELVKARVDAANRAAKEMGFTHVEYRATNLAHAEALPPADHFYLFNPTNQKTSAIVTRKLLELSRVKGFKVHLLSILQCAKFYETFQRTDDGWVVRQE